MSEENKNLNNHKNPQKINFIEVIFTCLIIVAFTIFCIIKRENRLLISGFIPVAIFIIIYYFRNMGELYNINDYQEISSKSRIKCFLLWLIQFVVPIAAHRFYAGRIISAIIMSVLEIISFIFILYYYEYEYFLEYEDIPITILIMILILFISTIISALWRLIDLIQIIRGKFKDSKGKYIKIIK